MEQSPHEPRPHQRLASTDGQASTGSSVESRILHDFVHDLLNGHPVTRNRTRVTRADGRALEAPLAFRRLSTSSFRGGTPSRSRGADLDAFVAPDAAPWMLQQFGLDALRFRIAAPVALQRTSLEEDDGADARPVVDGVSLNVEYDGRLTAIREGGRFIQTRVVPRSAHVLSGLRHVSARLARSTAGSGLAWDPDLSLRSPMSCSVSMDVISDY